MGKPSLNRAASSKICRTTFPLRSCDHVCLHLFPETPVFLPGYVSLEKELGRTLKNGEPQAMRNQQSMNHGCKYCFYKSMLSSGGHEGYPMSQKHPESRGFQIPKPETSKNILETTASNHWFFSIADEAVVQICAFPNRPRDSALKRTLSGLESNMQN